MFPNYPLGSPYSVAVQRARRDGGGRNQTMPQGMWHFVGIGDPDFKVPTYPGCGGGGPSHRLLHYNVTFLRIKGRQSIRVSF